MTALTEDLIERRVERMVDHLDRVFMSGQMTEKNYTLAMRELHQWAEEEYRKIEVQRRAERRAS